MNISRKKALVTGAAKRVGRVIALALAQKGCDILLHYRSSEQDALKTAREIRDLGVRCELLKADLGQTRDVQELLKTIAGQNLWPDILVNSASIFYKTPLDQVKQEDFESFITVNLEAPFLLSIALGRSMMEKDGGRIINIADWSGTRPYKEYAPYCASKGGLITLTKALARDLAPKVLVNAVAPGPVLLPEDFTEEERQRVIKRTLLGRTGTPEDIARAVCFLLDNDFINGTVLTVDGGRSIN